MVQIAGLEPDRAGFADRPNPATGTATRRARSAGRARAVEVPGLRGGRLDLRPRAAGARRAVGRGPLSDDAFPRARAYVLDIYGELT